MKHAKKASNPVYREEYLKGYEAGLDPYNSCEGKVLSAAYTDGFEFGRSEYEGLNGFLCLGIPKRIVTKTTLEDFLLAGMLGLSVDADGYTPFQLDVIEVWYRNGIDQYNPEQSEYLRAVLEAVDVELSY